MSLSYQPLEPVLVKDPRVIVDNKRVYAILKCGKETNFKKWTTNSVSSSNINFSTPPPSAGIIVDRKITLTLPMRITIPMTVPNVDGDYPVQDGYFAPRAFPIHSMLNTIQLTINNCSMTQNIGDIIHALLRFNTYEELMACDYSSTPSTLDTYIDYGQGAGANNNPLALQKDKSFFGMAPRGGFAFYRVIQNIGPNNAAADPDTQFATTVVIDMLCTEQIMMSPLYWGKDNGSGFTNVVSMDWVFNFYNAAGNRAVSIAKRGITGGVAIYNQAAVASVVFDNFNSVNPAAFSFPESNKPLLNINYITPDNVVSPSLPISYPYFSIDKFVTPGTAIAFGATSTTQTSNNIQLSSIPRRVYIYIRPGNAALFGVEGSTISDCYYSIEKINLQFGNRTGLFAEASTEKLYEISRKNHCSLSWSDWSGGPVIATYPSTKAGGAAIVAVNIGTVGSVFCFELASDLGLDPSLAPGIGQGTYNLQVDVQYKNKNSSGYWNTIVPELYIVPVYEGTFTITGLGSAMTQTAVISYDDVKNAQQNPMYNYKDVQEVNGGNFMSGLKNLVPRLKQANKFLKDNKVVSRAADAASYIPGMVGDVARDISSVAKQYGYGYGCEGGVVLGGAKMTKKQLQNRLKNR